MTIIQALLLGITQGLTEFLPISSDGHLLLAQHLMGLKHVPLFFDVILHVASLAAIIIFFLPRWLKLSRKNIYFVAIATIPAVVAGLIVEPLFESLFRNLYMAGLGFFITGSFLLLAHRFMTSMQTPEPMTAKKAFVIGLMQALAIAPGISRSGSTITAALWQKIDREEAFSFIFLMAVPAIAGAFGLHVIKGVTLDVPWQIVGWGFLAAFVTSLLALSLLQWVISNRKLNYFGIYCLAIGLFTLLMAVRA
jgi:undecaprenyl-diphosphatase